MQVSMLTKEQTTCVTNNSNMARVLFIEPFFGGSHKQLLDTIIQGVNLDDVGYELYTLPDKKWHWRARTSALYFAEVIPKDRAYKILFSSSVLNLAELSALRPDLMALKKVLYFHENQLVYPVRKQQERDFQYGYNQIISCLVADVVLFNSQFNLSSFLSSIPTFFKLQPDYRPSKSLPETIRSKCRVLYFPVSIQKPPNAQQERKFEENTTLHIVWPHRWEHDKAPEKFFTAVDALIEKGCRFRLSVLGEQYSEVPSIFEESRLKYEASSFCDILDWGFVTRDRYLQILSSAHVVVSTALHEFFGVSMIEAATLGCYPLCPLRLSYPEIFPEECLYKTELQLVKKLKNFCKNPLASRKLEIDLERFSWKCLKPKYEDVLLPKQDPTTSSS